MVQLILSIFGFYGVISNDTTWSDTAYLTGDVLVKPGVTLTIAPGTVVLYADSSEWDTLDDPWVYNIDIFIDGNLKAIGVVEDSIIFKYCEGMGYIKTLGGFDSLSFCSLSGSHSINSQNSRIVFNHSSGIPIEMRGGFLSVQNSSFVGCGSLGYKWKGVIYGEKLDSCIVDNVRIEGAYGLPTSLNGGSATGCFFDSCQYVRIENSLFQEIEGGYAFTGCGIGGTGGDGCGIYLKKCNNVLLDNNILTSIVGGDGQTGSMSPGRGGNGYAFIFKDCEDLLIQANQISDIHGGRGEITPDGDYYGHANPVVLYNSNPIITNNDFNSAGTYIYIDSTSHPVIGGAPGAGNHFLNAIDRDYVIYNDSPYDIDATWNFWECAPSMIDSLIYDHYDDPSKGIVHYEHATGVKEEKSASSPEPFSIASTVVQNVLSISLPQGGGGCSIIELFDAAGRKVKMINTSEREVSLCISDLSRGVYFVSLKSDDERGTSKIIVK